MEIDLSPRPSLIDRIGFNRFAIALCLAVGVAAGIISAAVHPAAGFGALAAFVVLWAMLRNPAAGVVAFVVVTYVMPFAVVPLSLGGVRLTVVDFALTGVLVVWIAGLLARPERGFVVSPADLPVLVFVGLAVTSLILSADQVSAEITRFFLKSVNAILFYFSVTNAVRSRADLVLVIRVGMLSTGLAATLALLLYLLPGSLSSELLNSLHVLGYPSGDVLRYIAGTRTLRAIGTAIDPNVLGGMLIVMIPIALAQVLDDRPVLPRPILVGALGLALVTLLLTYSRGSWAGLVGGVVFLATARYRKLWVACVVFAAVLYFLPAGEAVFERIESGVSVRDQAAGMRLGEYKDAITLIQRYPLFGVGFGDAPSIDLYVATSSVYLLIAEEMGLIGLSVFLVIVGVCLGYSGGRFRTAGFRDLAGIQIGTLAAIIAALVAGLFDHYFFNLHFPHTVALFWLVTGLGIVSARLGREPTSDAPPRLPALEPAAR